MEQRKVKRLPTKLAEEGASLQETEIPKRLRRPIPGLAPEDTPEHLIDRSEKDSSARVRPSKVSNVPAKQVIRRAEAKETRRIRRLRDRTNPPRLEATLARKVKRPTNGTESANGSASAKFDTNIAAHRSKLFNQNVLAFFSGMVKPFMTSWTAEQAQQYLDTMRDLPIGMFHEDDLRCYFYAFFVVKLRATPVDYKAINEKLAQIDDARLDFNDLDDEKADGQKQRPFDVSSPNKAQGGEVWGGLDADDEQARKDKVRMHNEKTVADYKPLPTMKEAQDAAKKRSLEASGGYTGSPDMLAEHLEGLEKIRAEAADPMKQKWAIAEAIAGKPEADWSVTGEDFELRLMVEHCAKWIRETNSVPAEHEPDNLIEIFWPKDRIFRDTSDEAVKRRQAIVIRVDTFLKGAKADKDPESASSYDFNPIRDRMNGNVNSYRITLASMNLEMAIEDYATGYRNQNMIDYPAEFEAHLAEQVKIAVTAYSKAFNPVETLGTEPGPETTLDPPYIEYLRLCRKYNLQPGVFLHEQKL